MQKTNYLGLGTLPALQLEADLFAKDPALTQIFFAPRMVILTNPPTLSKRTACSMTGSMQVTFAVALLLWGTRLTNSDAHLSSQVPDCEPKGISPEMLELPKQFWILSLCFSCWKSLALSQFS